MNANVLLVGESWVSNSTHIKGFDFFSSSLYATGGDFLISALQERGIQVSHLPSHQAAKDFPFELGKLQLFDVVILSDIGANTFWTSDIGPHWCPKEFVDWKGYGEVWTRIIRWLCKAD